MLRFNYKQKGCSYIYKLPDCMSEKRGSNPRPSVWETDALPAELFSLIYNTKVENIPILY